MSRPEKKHASTKRELVELGEVIRYISLRFFAASMELFIIPLSGPLVFFDAETRLYYVLMFFFEP